MQLIKYMIDNYIKEHTSSNALLIYGICHFRMN